MNLSTILNCSKLSRLSIWLNSTHLKHSEAAIMRPILSHILMAGFKGTPLFAAFRKIQRTPSISRVFDFFLRQTHIYRRIDPWIQGIHKAHHPWLPALPSSAQQLGGDCLPMLLLLGETWLHRGMNTRLKGFKLYFSSSIQPVSPYG